MLMMTMYQQPAFAAAIMLVLLLVGQQGGVEGACKQVENRDLVEYQCDAGSAEDLKDVPENVEKLRVSHMPIKHLSDEHFSRFPNLVVLALSHCEIADIDDNAFTRLRGLQQLSLDNNKLSEIKSNPFRDLRALTYLDLNYNEISKIDGEVFRHLPDIVDLRLSGNRLSCVDFDSMAELRELKRIYISENPGFACPNALKRFLNDRHIDFEHDPAWHNVNEDRIHVLLPLPPPPSSSSASPSSSWDDEEAARRRDEEEARRRIAAHHHDMSSSRPRYEDLDHRRREQEEEMIGREEGGDGRSREDMTMGSNEMDEDSASLERRRMMEGSASTINVTPGHYPSSSSRRPYYASPDTIQPSSPDQDFQYQGPYYTPGVTQQDLENYRGIVEDRARNASEHAWNRTTGTIANVTGQLVDHEMMTTTECPNSAVSEKFSWAYLSLLLVALTTTTKYLISLSCC